MPIGTVKSVSAESIVVLFDSGKEVKLQIEFVIKHNLLKSCDIEI